MHTCRAQRHTRSLGFVCLRVGREGVLVTLLGRDQIVPAEMGVPHQLREDLGLWAESG